MTIPDSLQIFGDDVFVYCSKLVPSSIDINDVYNDDDVTSEVVAHLRSEMSLNALLSGNNFLNTDDFRRLIVPYLQGNALMAIKLASKPWSRVADEFTDDGVESGAMIVHDGSDLSWDLVEAREESPLLVTRVIVLLNITKVRGFACYYAVNLVVVDIPEGVESIVVAHLRSLQSPAT
ncbi:hypothetical protein TL16_g02519 [Triparma laevis f. inornata]|uniref:Uncharacterized protein n=1 Tax=Triparma laevis f. inornata TaxID=1714386 RepID=A0A9W6ZRI5_9STRA|nr:hypothetical protein TL16_g02519 [Triparma laevis f. inornata]